MNKDYKKVLVVEWENGTRRAVSHIAWQRFGCSVVECETGQQALDVLAKEQFDAVVSGELMPRYNGSEVAQKMRTEPEYSANSRTPFILTTAAEDQACSHATKVIHCFYALEEITSALSSCLNIQAKQQETAGAEALPACAKPQGASRGNVVIIEEFGAVADCIESILKDAGYTVSATFSNGETCLPYLAKTKVDAIFCDWRMPKRYGTEVLALLREDPAYKANKDTPFILMSGAIPKPSGAEQADAFLQKPFSLEDLLAAARKFVVTK